MDKNARNTLVVIAIFAVLLPVLAYKGRYDYRLSDSEFESRSDAHDFSTGEIDGTTTVTSVTDGDTFETSSKGRVRLADIDAPESGESGYYGAKNFLESLVHEKTVYLDIDDIYRTDQYGRLVCVVYTKYNSTHFINVNKALLTSGHAKTSNYDNEFFPFRWTLYCRNLETSKSQDTHNDQPPSDTEKPGNDPPSAPSKTKKFVGSVNSNVYHYPSCYWAKKIKPYNRIWFSSSKDARAHGYRPCKVCKPP